ncbi:MAG: tetratricopeptide repeat protein [Methanosarcinales archaeon]|nr:tetratricopeptide repeat protein [Methanosarcinales archaeon]
MTEIKDPLETRVSRLANYLIRAHKYNKASILFALYLSEYVRIDVEKEIKKLLNEQGLEAISVDAGEHKDLPSFFSLKNSDHTVFFVQNMEKGFPEALKYLNFKREEIVEYKVKAVFWVTDKELTCIDNEAPDFFAFRNRVVEFVEVPLAEEHRPALTEFAMETDYRYFDEIKHSIELKETLLSELSKDDEISGYLLNSLGILYLQISLYKKAIEYLEQALVIAQEIGDRRGEGNRLGNLGNAYRNLGQVEKAIEYYQKALVIDLEIGNRRGEGIWLGNLGNAYRNLGQVEKAIEYYQKALVIDLEIGNRRGEGNRLGNLGNAYSYLGQVEKAIEYYEKALEIGKEIKDPRMINFCEENLKSLRS